MFGRKKEKPGSVKKQTVKADKAQTVKKQTVKDGKAQTVKKQTVKGGKAQTVKKQTVKKQAVKSGSTQASGTPAAEARLQEKREKVASRLMEMEKEAGLEQARDSVGQLEDEKIAEHIELLLKILKSGE